MSIASHLTETAEDLSTILSRINLKLLAKGSTSAVTLSKVPEKIDAIAAGGIIPQGTKSITANGTGIDVYNYANVDVNVQPSGTKTITANGTGIDVADYAAVDVAVPGPSGNILIEQNATGIDIAQYATADVAVPTGGGSLETTTDTQPSDIVADKTAYTNYNGVVSKVTGNVPVKTGTDITITESTGSLKVPAGVYRSNVIRNMAVGAAVPDGFTVNTTTNKLRVYAYQGTSGWVPSGSSAYGDLQIDVINASSPSTITPATSPTDLGPNKFIKETLTIAGDSNLIPANIKSGVSIFGVAGSYSGSGGGGGSTLTQTATTGNVYINTDKLEFNWSGSGSNIKEISVFLMTHELTYLPSDTIVSAIFYDTGTTYWGVYGLYWTGTVLRSFNNSSPTSRPTVNLSTHRINMLSGPVFSSISNDSYDVLVTELS